MHMPTCTHTYIASTHVYMPPHSLHSCVHAYTCIASTRVHMPTCAHIHNVGVAYIRMQRAGSGPEFESQGVTFRAELGEKKYGIHMVCLPRAVPGAPTTCQPANLNVQTPISLTLTLYIPTPVPATRSRDPVCPLLY